MLNVSTKVSDGKVTYILVKDGGEKIITQEEFVKESIKYADRIYKEVVEQAKKNKCVYTSWIQRHFKVNWYAASHIIEKMRDEGICGEYDSSLGASKIPAS